MASPRQLTACVAALSMTGYLLVARIAGNLYPFSTFGMYSAIPARAASRIVARDPTGTVRELTEFTSFRCDRPVDLSACQQVGDAYTIEYLDREARAYVGEAPLQPDAREATGAAVDVDRRVWHFEPGHEDPVVDDCLFSRCQAVDNAHR
jgi:hypothetical protein